MLIPGITLDHSGVSFFLLSFFYHAHFSALFFTDLFVVSLTQHKTPFFFLLFLLLLSPLRSFQRAPGFVDTCWAVLRVLGSSGPGRNKCLENFVQWSHSKKEGLYFIQAPVKNKQCKEDIPFFMSTGPKMEFAFFSYCVPTKF